MGAHWTYRGLPSFYSLFSFNPHSFLLQTKHLMVSQSAFNRGLSESLITQNSDLHCRIVTFFFLKQKANKQNQASKQTKALVLVSVKLRYSQTFSPTFGLISLPRISQSWGNKSTVGEPLAFGEAEVGGYQRPDVPAGCRVLVAFTGALWTKHWRESFRLLSPLKSVFTIPCIFKLKWI